jgi:hypothetical protein
MLDVADLESHCSVLHLRHHLICNLVVAGLSTILGLPPLCCTLPTNPPATIGTSAMENLKEISEQ